MILEACPHWIRIQTGSVTKLPNANPMCINRIHTIVRNRIHVCMLTLSSHTSTQLPWHPHQIFTSVFASQVEQIHATQCAAWRSTLTVGVRHTSVHATPFLVLKCNAQSRSIWIETTFGSGVELIRIGSRLGDYAFSVDALKLDSILFNAHWVSSVDRP